MTIQSDYDAKRMTADQAVALIPDGAKIATARHQPPACPVSRAGRPGTRQMRALSSR